MPSHFLAYWLCRLLVAWSLMFSGVAWGTSIVLHKDGDRIFVAADSRLTRGANAAGPGCKVFDLVPGVLVANARLMDWRVDSVSAIAKRVFSRPGTLLQKLTEFDKALVPRLADVAQALRIRDPKSFDEKMRDRPRRNRPSELSSSCRCESFRCCYRASLT
jgi:hypothetical protein